MKPDRQAAPASRVLSHEREPQKFWAEEFQRTQGPRPGAHSERYQRLTHCFTSYKSTPFSAVLLGA